MPAVASALGARLSGGRTATKRDEKLDAVARERLAAVKQQIADSLKAVQSGKPLDAEPDRARKVRRLQAVTDLPKSKAEGVVAAAYGKTMLAEDRKMVLTPAVPRVDFLEKGALSPRAVCRLAFRKDGQAEARCPPSDPASSGPQAPA